MNLIVMLTDDDSHFSMCLQEVEIMKS